MLLSKSCLASAVLLSRIPIFPLKCTESVNILQKLKELVRQMTKLNTYRLKPMSTLQSSTPHLHTPVLLHMTILNGPERVYFSRLYDVVNGTYPL